jgi:hypothetical protein
MRPPAHRSPAQELRPLCRLHRRRRICETMESQRHETPLEHGLGGASIPARPVADRGVTPSVLRGRRTMNEAEAAMAYPNPHYRPDWSALRAQHGAVPLPAGQCAAPAARSGRAAAPRRSAASTPDCGSTGVARPVRDGPGGQGRVDRRGAELRGCGQYGWARHSPGSGRSAAEPQQRSGCCSRPGG